MMSTRSISFEKHFLTKSNTPPERLAWWDNLTAGETYVLKCLVKSYEFSTKVSPRHATSNCSTYLLKSPSAILLWSPSTFQTRNDREQVLFPESAASLSTVLPVLSLDGFLVVFRCDFLRAWLLSTHSPDTRFLLLCRVTIESVCVLLVWVCGLVGVWVCA